MRDECQWELVLCRVSTHGERCAGTRALTYVCGGTWEAFVGAVHTHAPGMLLCLGAYLCM